MEKEFEERETTDKELADVIYIFTSKNKPGIRFYDRTPTGAVAKMIGTAPSGKFITDIYSIEQAKWDDSINKENTVIRTRTRYGSVVVKTFMIAEEQFYRILENIIEYEDKDYVVIDLIDRIHHKTSRSEIISSTSKRKK